MTGGNRGINADNRGSGALTITTAGASGTTGDGIRAVNFGADLTIDSRTGAVTGTTGVFATNDGTGAISITTANVTGTANVGVFAVNSELGTNLTINTTAGTVTARSNGIDAAQRGTGALSITAAGVTSANGSGILASAGGNSTGLTINSRTGAVSGTTGVSATNNGAGAVSITTANVSGTSGNGVVAINGATGTGLSVTTTAGSVTGSSNGISATNNGTGSTSITTANVAGTNGNGVIAINAATGSGLTINTSAGTVTGSSNGISATHNGAGAVSITTANVTGATSNGIYGLNSTRGTNLTITSGGTVTGRSNGVNAANNGAGSTSITTTGVTSANGTGILARAGGSSTGLTITTSGTVTGALVGIDAANNGTGTTSITTAGVSSGNGTGILASVGANSTGLTITTSNTVTGALVGIDARNASARATTIVNNGNVTAGSREAIRAANAANTLITNNGRIEGFVTLGAGNDNFTNAGTFAAIGNSNFGAGTDVLTSSGTVLVQGAAPASLLGLESFANSGRVELANGIIGNNLSTSGSFAGSGNSALIVDVDIAARTADRLTIAGAATGSTAVTLNVIGAQQSGLFNIVIVDAGAGTTAGAFALVGGRQVNGLIETGLNFDPGANDFLLASTPSLPAYEFSNFGDFARNAWQQSANAFANQMTMTRDTGRADRGVRVWLTGYGSSVDRERITDTSFNGLTNTHDLGYSQDAIGFLAGVDLGSDALRFGVTGGYQNNEADFNGSEGGVSFDVFSFGGYVAADFGLFWANALVKYDTISGTVESTAIAVVPDFDGSVFGAQGEVGALVGSRDGLFLEPKVSLAYSSADLEDITVTQGTFAFDSGESLLGKAGARAGTGLDLGSIDGVVYVGGDYVHEFEGNDSVLFGAGAGSALLTNLVVDDYAELSAGIAIGGDEDAFGASLQGTFLAGSGIEGYGASLNLRYRFGGRAEPVQEAPPPPPPPVVVPPPPRPAPPPPPKPACNTGPFIVFFDFDKYDITSEAASILNSAVTAYANCGTARVMLAGHTDRAGTEEYNMGLAKRRNDSVSSYMTGRGVPAGSITSEAFGETKPRVPTADGVREAQNRRVEVTYGPGSGR